MDTAWHGTLASPAPPRGSWSALWACSSSGTAGPRSASCGAWRSTASPYRTSAPRSAPTPVWQSLAQSTAREIECVRQLGRQNNACGTSSSAVLSAASGAFLVVLQVARWVFQRVCRPQGVFELLGFRSPSSSCAVQSPARPRRRCLVSLFRLGCEGPASDATALLDQALTLNTPPPPDALFVIAKCAAAALARRSV